MVNSAKGPIQPGKLQIIGDKECPSCAAKGRDSKGNHLILFQGENDEVFGKCNRCGHYEPPTGNIKPNERRVVSPEELAEQLAEVATFPFKPLTSRRIPLSTAERFGVRSGLSELDGETVVEHYYPRSRDGSIVAYNVRHLDPKGFYYRGSPKGGTDMFGYEQCKRKDVGRQRLIIFEDELSCMSGFTVVEARTPEKYRHLKPACMSWSAGAGSAAKDIQNHVDFFKNFKEVVYVHDNDEQGRTSVEVVRAILPDCKFVTTPLKDANDMHMARREDELFSLMLFQSKTKAPDCAVGVMDILAEAMEPPKWGKSYPWEGLTNLTFGQRDGELISIGGGTGVGKTLLAHAIAAHNINEHGEKVGVCLLEESNGNSLKNIAGKIAKVPFHRPDLAFDADLFEKVARGLAGSLFLWRNKGQNDWENIATCIRFWAVAEGVKSVFIDNMTTLVNHLNPAEQNTEIARIATQCAGLADELGIRIFIFSHLNPPGGSKSHEEGAEVKENQFTGSRALQRWSQLMLGFERNKQADGDGKHNSVVRVLKDRNFGNTGVVYTKYEPDTGCLVERAEIGFDVGAEDDGSPI